MPLSSKREPQTKLIAKFTAKRGRAGSHPQIHRGITSKGVHNRLEVAIRRSFILSKEKERPTLPHHGLPNVEQMDSLR